MKVITDSWRRHPFAVRLSENPNLQQPRHACRMVMAISAVAFALVTPGIQAADILVPGVVKREVFNNATRAQVEANTAGAPSLVTYPSIFEMPLDQGDNFSERVSTQFIPPASGNYVFFVASDDDTDLFLSTDATAANKQLIAQEASWSNNRNWNTPGGGTSSAEMKRSDMFIPAGATEAPFAAGIPLVAGQQYYLEAVHHDGGSGDNLSVTFKLTTDPDPVDGEVTKLTGSVIGVSIPAPTELTITNPPQSRTVYAGATAQLSVGASTDSQIPPAFQWRRNGTNLPGATAATYSFITAAADSGSTFDVIVSVPGISRTSAVATVTVPATGAVTFTGIKEELWAGATRADVEAGRAGTPTYVRVLNSFEAPVDVSDGYARRLSGFFTPDTTGSYVFFISSDDDSSLFLSTDATPANKQLIAQETAWSAARAWTSSGGGSDITLKRSDTFSTDGGVTMPYASGIELTAGQAYYIEAVQREGNGGDNLGVTFKLISEADPLDGDASRLTGSLVSLSTGPATTLSIGTQPRNTTVAEGGSTNLSVTIQTDAEISPVFQWRRNGVNIGGATNSTYTISSAAVVDNNARYSVVVSLPGFTNTVTSSEAVLTVESGVLSTGFLKREIWAGQTRANVLSGAAGISTNVTIQTSGESPANISDNYASRVSGFFIPPTSGNYVFFLAADDDTDLFLSTDENPANKKLIAQEASWSNARAWNTPGGTSTAENKRSDLFPTSEWTTPNVISLVAGQRYYLEAAHHDGTGGDHVHITYKLDTEPDPVDGDPTRLTGTNIAFLAPPATITISQQPQSVTGVQSQTATFRVVASTTSPFPGLGYQWFRDGVAISGATGTEYTTGLLTLADNNAQFTVRVSGPGATAVTSQAATLTVNADATAPAVVSAGAFNGGTSIGLTFSESLDPASILAGSFQVSGGTVTGATLHGNNFVELTLAAAVGANFTVTATGVRDLAGNAAAATPVNGTISDMLSQDLGIPVEPGIAVSSGSGFFVQGGGLDLWGNADSGFFVYKQFTGAFDMRARVDSLIGGDEWAKAALMARETLDAGSRNEAVLITKPGPYEGDEVASVTPSRGGQNQYNHQWRNATDGASESKADAERIRPTVFPSWIRLVRESTTSNEFKSYISYDGQNWTLFHTHTQTGALLPATLSLGMAVTTHDDTPGYPQAQAVFSNFSIQPFENSTQPTLNVARSDNSITISWQGSGFRLQESTNLETWTDVAGVTGTSATVQTTGASRFFRLVQ